MRFGPTSLQVSSVLAKGLKRPKLRSDLRISGQTIAGGKSYVIKILETNSYNRYGELEYELLTLCDGTRTAAEIAEAMNERDPNNTISESEVLDFLESVEPAMWERTLGEKNLAVLERIRDERKSRIDQSNVLYMSFKAWDPDKTLARIDPYLSWFFTPGFIIFSVLLFIFTLYFLADDWTRVQQDTASLYSFTNKRAYDIWSFWVLFFVLNVIHEFGHGLTCKHFGGDVHQMGLLLINFLPAVYTDTTDILLFPRAFHRLWVIFAGIWIELVLCGVSATIWHFTFPGTIVNDLAYKMMLLSGIQAVLMNLNPLVKADGYYALAQFLRIDNLREESFAYLRAWTRKYILGHDIDLPQATRRQRHIFLSFSLAAIFYSVSALIFVLFFVKNILVSKLGDWGYLATAVLIYFFGRKGLRTTLPTARAWLRGKREAYMAWKITRTQQAGAAVVLLLLLIPPIPSSVSTDLVLEPGKEARLRAEVPGLVGQVFVKQGDVVKAGKVMAILENPEILADATVISAKLSLASSDLRSKQDLLDSAKAAQAARERVRLQEELAVAQGRMDAFEIRSPLDGVVTTSGVDQTVGEYLSAGDEFCRIVIRSKMRARILVRDWELEDVRPNASVELKLVSFPFRTYSGHVEKILPAAAADQPIADTQKLTRFGQDLTNYFAVIMEFSNLDDSLREGMTGTAKIATPRNPIAWHIGHSAWRWLQSRVW